jgi:dynein heavy chain 2
MEKLSRALDEVDQKVAQYRNRFETLTKEAAELKIKLDKENETILAAETLVSKLDGEYTRWNNQVIMLNFILLIGSSSRSLV